MKWFKWLLLISLTMVSGVGLGWGRYRWEGRERKKAIKKETAMFVAAHPDDDLLFMNPDISKRIELGGKVVVVFLTSGDAGQDEGYWRERERGIELAYKEMVGRKTVWQRKRLKVDEKHDLTLVESEGGQVKLIFWRLPDGSYWGKGYERTDWQSLDKLYFGEIKEIVSLDGESFSREELVDDLKNLMAKFKVGYVGIQDFTRGFGEGDHSDHVSGAKLVMEAAKLRGKGKVGVYVDYEISGWLENLETQVKKEKERFFLIYANHDKPVLGLEWQKWIGKRYWRMEMDLKEEKSWQVRGPLRVEKGELVDRNGKIVRLVGVATKVFRWKRNNCSVGRFWKRWEVMRDYGVNSVMAYIYPDTFEKFKQDIDELVKKGEEEGFVVALVPVEDKINFGNSQRRIESAMRFPEFIGKVAKRYGDRKNVLYGIWTEPANMGEKKYVDYINRGIEAIREQVKNAVVIVDGLNYGRKIDELADFKKMSNVILDFHDYPAEDEVGLSRFLKDWKGKFIWEKYVGKGLPVMVGEFGGMWRDGFGSKLDLWWIERELERIDQKRASYVMYTMDDEGGLGLFEGEGVELSEKGKLFRDYLLGLKK